MNVTPDVIAVALGRSDPPSASEHEQWSLWIADAEMLIDARAEALGITDPLPEIRLDYVIREAVIAHLRRPDAATQITVSVQDASTTKMYNRSSGRIAILDEWWTLLGLTSESTGAFAVDTVGTGSVHAAMCALNFGATYCSCGADLTNYAYPLFGCDPW